MNNNIFTIVMVVLITGAVAGAIWDDYTNYTPAIVVFGGIK